MLKISPLRLPALTAALALALLAAGQASADPILVNGSFESPAETPNSITEITLTGIPGWTGNSIGGAAHEYIINGNVQDLQGRNYGTTPFGAQYLGLNAIARRSFRSIESQVVSGFTVGQPYALTLYIANLDGATDPKISAVASADSGTGATLASALFTAPVEGPYGNGTIDFVQETLVFVPTTGTVSFSIGNQSLTGTMGIDNVSLAAVPEPTALATLLAGAAALGGLLVRRRARRS